MTSDTGGGIRESTEPEIGNGSALEGLGQIPSAERPSSAPTTPSRTSLYEGFDESTRLLIVKWGALIAIDNLLIAWALAVSIQSRLSFGEADTAAIEKVVSLSGPLPTAGEPSPNRYALVEGTAFGLMHVKGVVNRQAIAILAFGAGFALAALGFSLFLLGMDGAFKVAVQHQEARIVFAGAAPGLLCFLLAASLMGYAVSRQHELDLPYHLFTSTIRSPTIAFQGGSSHDSTAKESPVLSHDSPLGRFPDEPTTVVTGSR